MSDQPDNSDWAQWDLRAEAAWARATQAEADARRLRDAAQAREAALMKTLEPLARWPSVFAFALAMVAKLDHHAPKKGGREGWLNDSPGLLADRAEEEMEEFQRAPKAETLAEAADVANMLMMSVDADGLLNVEAARAALASPSAAAAELLRRLDRAIEHGTDEESQKWTALADRDRWLRHVRRLEEALRVAFPGQDPSPGSTWAAARRDLEQHDGRGG